MTIRLQPRPSFQLPWLALILVLMLVLVGCYPKAADQRSAHLVVGGKSYAEQLILGEMLAQYIEGNTTLRVERKLNLGGTFICHQGIKAGELDSYVEFTGTAYTAILGREPISDRQQVYEEVKTAYAKQFGVAVTPPLGYENTYALIMRRDDARRLNLETISGMVPYAPQLTLAAVFETLERQDGFPGLAQAYGLRFARPPWAMEGGLLYLALIQKKVDVIMANSTDGQILRLGLATLRDDQSFFPPYDAIPLIRQQTLERYPVLGSLYEKLGGTISTREMQALNYQVVGEFRSTAEVARGFLKSKGLVP